jgi:thiol-disulfide isomerase/thioredoxin
MSKEIKIFLGIIIGFIVIIAGSFIINSNTPGRYDTFAQCLTDSGTKFYGASWCSHCQSQKLLFGKSVKKLPYVECALDGQEKIDSDKAVQQAIADGKLLPNQDPETIGIKVRTNICKENNISGFPTWVFPDGSRVSGTQTLALLAERTSCNLPQ